MKKLILLLMIALGCVNHVSAQQKVITKKQQFTQARLLDVTSNAYVKPLTVELQVDKSKGRITDVWNLSIEDVESLKNDLTNIRSYGVYMSSNKHNVDVIVAATFNFCTNDAGTGYVLTVVGYPANFVNWKTAEASDMEWIRMEKALTTSDREKISAVVK